MRDRRILIRRDRHYVVRAQLVLVLARLCVQRRRAALVAVRHCVHIICVRIAVVRPALRRGRNLQFLRARRDRQSTKVLAQRVVALLRRAVPRQLVRVRAVAYRRLAARDFERRRLVVHKAGNRSVCSQCSTIIFLVRALRDDRQRRRRYTQRAVICCILIVRVGRLNHVVDRTVRNVRDARDIVGPGFTTVGAVLDRRAFRYARGCAAFVRIAVIDTRIVDRINRHGCLRDRQFAGVEGLGLVVAGDVFACCVQNRERRLIEAAILICSNIRALGRGVDDRQNVALAQAFYLIVISLDRLARAGDRRNERTAFLFGAVIDLLDVLDRHGQRSRRDIQGAEGCIDLIVARLVLAPVDGVGVITAAYRRLRTGHAERDRLARAEGDRTGRRRFCRSPLAADVRGPVAVGQRCAFFFC